jgi:hypothetical protein
VAWVLGQFGRPGGLDDHGGGRAISQAGGLQDDPLALDSSTAGHAGLFPARRDRR